MGIDSVELLVEIENTFNIRIPDIEAEQIGTVGALHNAVWHYIAGRSTDKCASQHLFYRLRRSFADSFNIPPQHLTTNTPTEEIFPLKNRRTIYTTFALDSGLNFPPLVLTKRWSQLLTGFGMISIAGGFAASLVLICFYQYAKWTLLIPLAGIALTALLSRLLNPMRIMIRETTLRAFIERLLALNYSVLVKDAGNNRREMETVINHIIAEKSGIDLNDISPEKNFHNDLGID